MTRAIRPCIYPIRKNNESPPGFGRAFAVKLGFIGSIRNSEFGIRNCARTKGLTDISPPRFFKSLGYQCLLTRHQVPVFDRAPPSEARIIPNSAFRIPNFGRRPLNCNLKSSTLPTPPNTPPPPPVSGRSPRPCRGTF